MWWNRIDCYNMDKKNRKIMHSQFYNFWLSMEVTENEELSFGLEIP